MRSVVQSTFVFALIVLAQSHLVASADHRTSDPETFEEFSTRYGRAYRNTNERAQRQRIFQQNLEHIREHNLRERMTGEFGFTMRVNNFADWTPEELRHIAGGNRHKKTAGYKEPCQTFNGSQCSTTFDSAVDYRLRTPPLLTPIKNQGNCGNCYAFSATETIESFDAIINGRLQARSVQQITSCSQTMGCDGGYISYALDYVAQQKKGLATNDVYPWVDIFTNEDQPPQACNGTLQNESFFDESRAKITGCVDLWNDIYGGGFDPAGDELKAALTNIGPLSIVVNANSFSWFFFDDGIIPVNCATDFDHAIQLVGYGSEQKWDNTTQTYVMKDYWIVRNSWGVNWGDSGYARMERNASSCSGSGANAAFEMFAYPLLQ